MRARLRSRLLPRSVRPRFLLWGALLLLAFWSLRNISLAAVWSGLGRLEAGSLLTLISLNLLIFSLFSGRWWLILRAQGYSISYASLVLYRLASFGVSYFTPGSQFGGEPVQVYALRDRHSLPWSSALASVSLDKLLELFVNFSFLVIGVVITLEQGIFGQVAVFQVLLFVLGLLLLPTLYLAALWARRSPLSWAARRLLALGIVRRRAWGSGLARLQGTIARTEEQVGRFCREKPGALFAALALSLVVWLAMVAEYWLMLRFLGLPFTLAQAITALTAARLAYLVPTPMGLGAVEAGQVFAMQALGADPALGLSASLLMRARDMSLGLAGLWLASSFTRSGPVGEASSSVND